MAGSVRRERVTFPSAGAELVGDLYHPVPAGGVEVRGPGVVVAGSWTTVKEQTAGLYARCLAERGVRALAFDFTGFGGSGSGGGPRDAELPARKVADLAAAVRFLCGHRLVDPGQVALLGVGAGGGYAAVAAASDPLVGALALVVPWWHDAGPAEAVQGSPDVVRERLAAAAAARDEYVTTGQVRYVPAVSETDPAAAMYGPFDYYLDPARGAVPEWSNRFAVLAWADLLAFDPIAHAGRIGAPTLVVQGEDVPLPEGVRRFHGELRSGGELLWLKGTRFDFYDGRAQVEAAVTAGVEHFRRAFATG